jgi:acetyl esterase/lipase
MRTVSYGPLPDQVGDLYLPTSVHPAVVCLLHGGFWRMPYDRQETTAIARDLAERGYAVWNLEYRRLGATGGGWPGTFEDVAAGIDHLAALQAGGDDLDLDCVIVTGHSAGGHLALWSATHRSSASVLKGPTRVRPVAAAGLAPVLDLERLFAENAGGGAVAELLGGGPERYPERYAAASPMTMLPLGVRQLILHGTRDEALPIEQSRTYATAAAAAGDRIQFTELPGADHMPYLDPDSEAHATLCRWLSDVVD